MLLDKPHFIEVLAQCSLVLFELCEFIQCLRQGIVRSSSYHLSFIRLRERSAALERQCHAIDSRAATKMDYITVQPRSSNRKPEPADGHQC